MNEISGQVWQEVKERVYLQLHVYANAGVTGRAQGQIFSAFRGRAGDLVWQINSQVMTQLERTVLSDH